MKMKWCVMSFLLLLLYAVIQLHAQNTDLDRKIFEQMKIKAEKGDAGCQSAIGWNYFNGVGVERDQAEGIKWYRKAVEQNSAEGEWYLADCYFRGDGVEQNYSEAAKLFRKAADQGNHFAQGSLATCYSDGKGVAQDYSEAFKWYGKAADQGDDVAEFNLGNSYNFGRGVTQNYSEAVKWYRKAAAQGFAQAQYNLGAHYGDGKGVTQNDLEAYIWSSLAAAQGIQEAPHNRDLFASRMSREEIIEGQRRAAAFAPQKETPSASSNNFATQANPTVVGTGFFITDDGYLISNYHVIKDAKKVRLVTSAGTVDAKVVHADAANDLALLKADEKCSPLPIAASRSAHLGGTVATIGFPDPSLQGFSPKLAKGEIASLSGASDDPRYFQISVPVQPGNSGGALVDERGNVIGVVSAKLDASVALAASGALPENVNYAIKSSFLLSFLESMPGVQAKLKIPNSADEKFEDVVKAAQDAAVLVLVY
jgi:S1-C subfamily serine protease